jgi:copper transport protein
VAVFAFAGTLLLLGGAPAWAHPYLVQTLPGPGAIVSQPPPAIEIGFTERIILEGSSLELRDPEGQPAALGPLLAGSSGCPPP